MARSTHDEDFLDAARNWLAERGEIFVMIRLSQTGGRREYRFIKSMQEFLVWLAGMSPKMSVIFFRQAQLPLRGVVDDAMIAEAVGRFTDDNVGVIHASAYLSEERSHVEGCGWNLEWGGHGDLIEDLNMLRGQYVAIGLDPPWLHDSDDVLGAYVPDPDGVVRPGAY